MFQHILAGYLPALLMIAILVFQYQKNWQWDKAVQTAILGGIGLGIAPVLMFVFGGR